MNPNTSEPGSPLSRFLEDDTITITESILPYCNPSIGKILALRIKFLEIQKILHGFDDIPYLQACGFEENSKDMETVLRSLRGSVSEEKAKQIDSVLSMIRFSKLYQTYQEITKSHPELLQGQERRGGEGVSGGTSDIFSDPSLFFMLNSLMNNEDNQNDKLKKVLDIAMTGNGENKDFAEILSTFMKK